MTNLLRKEFRLSMHPTVLIFLCLSALMIVPNYPYYVTFFYTGLALFFTCLNGREFHDVYYTMLLPVAKKDIVKARFLFALIVEALQIVIAIPFAFIRQQMPVPPNQVGMDANIALFGFSLIMLGLFNFVFFTLYYKDVNQVGKAFVIASVVTFFYIMVMETLAHVIPLFKDKLDTNDPLFLKEKMIVLAIGIIVFAALTYFGYMKSVKEFEVQDV